MGVLCELSLLSLLCTLIRRQQEEHPPIIANYGMGSILVNYYRKKSEKDEHIPKVGLGRA
jgi:transcription initiation factor TFIID subunit 1